MDPDPRKEIEVDPDLDPERGLKWIRIRNADEKCMSLLLMAKTGKNLVSINKLLAVCQKIPSLCHNTSFYSILFEMPLSHVIFQ